MSFIVKMMSAENLADDHPHKAFRLFANVDFFEPVKGEDGEVAGLYLGLSHHHRIDGSEVNPVFLNVVGNVYVMNENGKTVASFSSGQDHRRNEKAESIRAEDDAGVI